VPWSLLERDPAVGVISRQSKVILIIGCSTSTCKRSRRPTGWYVAPPHTCTSLPIESGQHNTCFRAGLEPAGLGNVNYNVCIYFSQENMYSTFLCSLGVPHAGCDAAPAAAAGAREGVAGGEVGGPGERSHRGHRTGRRTPAASCSPSASSSSWRRYASQAGTPALYPRLPCTPVPRLPLPCTLVYLATLSPRFTLLPCTLVYLVPCTLVYLVPVPSFTLYPVPSFTLYPVPSFTLYPVPSFTLYPVPSFTLYPVPRLPCTLYPV